MKIFVSFLFLLIIYSESAEGTDSDLVISAGRNRYNDNNCILDKAYGVTKTKLLQKIPSWKTSNDALRDAIGKFGGEHFRINIFGSEPCVCNFHLSSPNLARPCSSGVDASRENGIPFITGFSFCCKKAAVAAHVKTIRIGQNDARLELEKKKNLASTQAFRSELAKLLEDWKTTSVMPQRSYNDRTTPKKSNEERIQRQIESNLLSTQQLRKDLSIERITLQSQTPKIKAPSITGLAAKRQQERATRMLIQRQPYQEQSSKRKLVLQKLGPHTSSSVNTGNVDDWNAYPHGKTE